MEHLLEEAAHSAARRGWRSMGCVSEAVAYGLIVASYRRRLGIVVVREFARHRYRQSQLVGLTREQLTAIARYFSVRYVAAPYYMYCNSI